MRVLLCPLPRQLLRSWVQRSMTSHVTCGPWASSCTSCEYHPFPAPPGTLGTISAPTIPGEGLKWATLPAVCCSLLEREHLSFRLPEGLPMPRAAGVPGDEPPSWGADTIALASGCLSPGQGLGEENGSAPALPQSPCRMTSALPQPVRLPALLLQHGPGHLAGDEEEDPPGPVWLPKP